ncbi:MAG: DUF2971 domain-containing protein [Bacteroidota bacterium]
MEDFNKYPKHFYKYTPLDMNMIKGLINSELWFSDPKTFNDPFDCKIELDFNCTPEELKNYLDKINQYYSDVVKTINDPTIQIKYIRERYGNQISDKDCINIIDRIYNKGGLLYTDIDKKIEVFVSNPEGLYTQLNNSAFSEVNKFRILSLSRINDSSTMWAHYANQHKGICLELELEKDIPFFTFPLKVRYCKKYPRFNYIKEWGFENEFVMHIFRSKYSSWRYEEEYRIVKDTRETCFKNGGLLSINRSAIKKVFFGLKSSDSDIDLVKGINIKYFDNKLILYKAIEKPKSFNLGFIRIK